MFGTEAEVNEVKNPPPTWLLPAFVFAPTGQGMLCGWMRRVQPHFFLMGRFFSRSVSRLVFRPATFTIWARPPRWLRRRSALRRGPLERA
jgi:hypothetical protein